MENKGVYMDYETQLKELGLLIQERRKELGLSGREAARKVGISAVYLGKLEHGINPKTRKPSVPSYEVLSRLDKILNLGNQAYRLAGYTTPSEVSGRPIQETNLRDLRWRSLLATYTDDLGTVFASLPEMKKGEMLEDIVVLLRKYRPESPT